MPVPQKIRCRLTKIIDHGNHVYTLDLVPERILPRFLPGQFLHLAIDPYDQTGFWPESRVFSIASSPVMRDRITLTYSVRGKFTTRMEKELKPGDGVWVKLPYGDFTIRADSDIVLLAGGTGITAFTAFVDGLKPDFPRKVRLFYGALTRELLIYRRLADEKQKCVPGFSPTYFIEKGNNLLSCEHIGRLSVEFALQAIDNPISNQYYLSGPPEMVKSFSTKLIADHIPEEQIHIDAWE